MAATIARPACHAAHRTSDCTMSRTRSVRSATTPAYALKSNAGTKRTIPAAPTQARECVRSNTNASSATLYAQLPVAEIVRLPSRRRTSRWLSADR